MHCASCGYVEAIHDLGTRRCPIETADKNGRRGTFRAPPPPGPASWREVVAADFAARRAADEAAARPYEPPPPPLIAARPPTGPAEYAMSNRGMSAVKLGRKAREAGWHVEPWYWMAHDGAEGCALRLAKGPLRAVALWKRKAADVGGASGWQTDTVYGWRTDVERFPTKMTHTDLEGLLR